MWYQLFVLGPTHSFSLVTFHERRKPPEQALKNDSFVMLIRFLRMKTRTTPKKWSFGVTHGVFFWLREKADVVKRFGFLKAQVEQKAIFEKKILELKQIEIQMYYPYLVGLKGAEDSFAPDFEQSLSVEMTLKNLPLGLLLVKFYYLVSYNQIYSYCFIT